MSHAAPTVSLIPGDSTRSAALPLIGVYLPLAALALSAIWARCPDARPTALAAAPAATALVATASGALDLFVRSGPLGALALATALEVGVLGWRSTSVHHLIRDRSVATRHDLGYLLLAILGWFPVLTVIFTAGALYGVALTWGAVRGAFPREVWSSGSLAVDALLFYLALTLIEYAWHRAQHSRRLWPLHRAHHAATHLSPLAAYRGHPAAELLNPVTNMLPGALPWLLVPVRFDLALVVLTCVGIHNRLEHTMLPWTLGWVGRWLLVSPIGHRIHHSPLPEHADRNFSTCPLWDRLFGTWYDGPVLNETVGLAEPREAHANLIREWVEDLRDLVGRG